MGFPGTDRRSISPQNGEGIHHGAPEESCRAGVFSGQFPILIELWHEEGLTQRQLLDRIDVEQATLANTLSRMERDGLIVRKSHPSDRRAQIIELTQRGRDLEANAIAASEATEDTLLADFRRFEKQLLLEYMRRAIDRAKKRNSIYNSKRFLCSASIACSLKVLFPRSLGRKITSHFS